MMTQQMFGGDWTEEKLERVRKYLNAYTKLMKGNAGGKYFSIIYIDAFAGTGYRTLRREDNPDQLLLPEFAEEEPQRFLDGSATIALKIKPQFDQYIFIEKNRKRFLELQKLKMEFSDFQQHIRLVQSDANAFIVDICKEDWTKKRAVLFLDPYGMQVSWKTVEAIAATQAIDLWYLFPLGAVSRLLRKDGQIDEPLRQRLNYIFGDTDWFSSFYSIGISKGLFGEGLEAI